VTHTVPNSPADPEAAALKLIIRLPADIFHTDRRATGIRGRAAR
jgi:hypothetical protein